MDYATTGTYAGDITPQDAWLQLSRDHATQLIDVRSRAEWNYVGLPDLSTLGKQTHCIAWQDGPDMALCDDFVERVDALSPSHDTPLLLLCRSGQRSAKAAEALTRVGYKNCYNILEGFEGPLNSERHRGRAGGWKVRNLPWTQS